MAVRTRQRVFNTVFPPEESPFLSGAVTAEQLSGEQQRLWDVVTRVLKPAFAAPFHEHTSIEDCVSLFVAALTCSVADRRAAGVERTHQKVSKGGGNMVFKYTSIGALFSF
jgi:hypothetical protein